MNKEELFQWYKEMYEDFKNEKNTCEMDGDQWCDYVENCQRLFYHAVDVLVRGMTLDQIKEAIIMYKSK